MTEDPAPVGRDVDAVLCHIVVRKAGAEIALVSDVRLRRAMSALLRY